MKRKILSIFLSLAVALTMMPAMAGVSFAGEVNTTVPVELVKAQTSGSKAIKLSWTEVSGATKYVVYGQKCGKSYKKLKTTSGTSYEVKKIKGKKLRAHKAYKFYVAAYSGSKKLVTSKSIHFITGKTQGKYANAKSISVKPTSLTLEPGKTATLKATTKIYKNKKHIKKSHGAATRYLSDTPAVATVNASGVETAVAEGTATIYVQDIGGLWCKTIVTVKSSEPPAPTEYTVSFDLNGATGEAPTAQTIASGGTATNPNPTFTNHTLEGWYKTKNADGMLSNKWDFNSPVTADMTLYAKWTRRIVNIIETVDFPMYTTDIPTDAWMDSSKPNNRVYGYNNWLFNILYVKDNSQSDPLLQQSYGGMTSDNAEKNGNSYTYSNDYSKYTVTFNMTNEDTLESIEVKALEGADENVLDAVGTYSAPTPVSVTGVTLDKESIDLPVGETDTLTAIVLPENATDKSVTWSSSDENVATVDSEGNVHAVAAGEATITVTTVDGNKTATCYVTVTAPAPEISKVEDVLATVENFPTSNNVMSVPDNAWMAVNGNKCYRTNSDLCFLPVTFGLRSIGLSNNVVKSGNDYIYSNEDSSLTVTFHMTSDVLTSITFANESSAFDGTYAPPVSVTSVFLDITELGLPVGDEDVKLTATVLPENATNKAVTWSSSDESVATVDSEGNVHAVAAGEATITVTTVDGNKTATCEVTVTAPAPAISKVEDVLKTVEGDFPTTGETAWKTNGMEKCCINGENLYFWSLKPNLNLPLATAVSGSGDSFTCSYDSVTFTFNMTEGKLTSIEVEGSESGFLDGTYAPATPL